MNAIKSVVMGFVCLAAGLAGADGVTGAYRALEYLQSDGTQWIDTGVVPTTKDVVTVKASSSSANTTLFGAKSSANNYVRIFMDSNKKLHVISCVQNDRNSGLDFPLDEAVTIVYDAAGKKISLNGSSYAIPDNATYAPTVSYHLLGYNNSGTSAARMTAKIYSFRIKSAIADHVFIPCCRVADNVCGFYDTYDGSFLVNANTAEDATAFTPGPESSDTRFNGETPEFLVTVAAGDGGSVSPTGSRWMPAKGGSLTVTATEDETHGFFRFDGAPDSAIPALNPMVFGDLSGPTTVTAQFGPIVNVASVAELRAALADESVVEGSVIRVAKLTETVTAEIVVNKGVVVESASGNPEDVRFAGRAPNTNGRVFSVNHKKAVLRNLVAEKGRAPSDSYAKGGCVLIGSSGGTVDGCVIRGGTHRNFCTRASGGGAGIACTGANGVIANCVITNNELTASGVIQGAGVYMTAGLIVNSFIAKNYTTTTANWGAGAHLQGSAKMFNCTVTGNSGPTSGGIDAYSDSVEVVNTLIWDNKADAGTDDIFTAKAGCFKNCLARVAINETCVGTGVLPSTGTFLVPTPASPALDASVRTSIALPAKDVLGHARVSGSAADIGAAEYVVSGPDASFRTDIATGLVPLTVTFTAATAGMSDVTGYGWDFDGDGIVDRQTAAAAVTYDYENAGAFAPRLTVFYGDSQEFVYAAPAGTIKPLPKVVYVANGNADAEYPYLSRETAAGNIQTALDAAIDGQEIVVLKSDNPYKVSAFINVTKDVTLRGETGNPEDVRITRSSGNIRIMRVNNAAALVHSLVLADGRDNGSNDYGIGLLVDSAGGTVSNCVIRGCVSIQYHSADSVRLSGTKALLTHSVVSNNTQSCTDGEGRCTGLGIEGGARAENCLIVDNRDNALNATVANGAVRVSKGALVNCTVVDNKTRGIGGVVCGADGIVSNCVIVANVSMSKGAGYHNYDTAAAARFVNCASDDDQPINGTCQTAPAAELFEGYSVRNYKVAADSVLIDNGVDYENMAAGDLAGEKRHRGKSVDIGCYEYDNETVRLGGGVKAGVTSAFVPVEIAFTATVTGASDPANVRLSWDFDGDGTYEIVDGTSLEEKWNYEAGATYDVNVLIRDLGNDSTYTVRKPKFLTLANTYIYVTNGNANAQAPYATRETAAGDFQTAIDAAIEDQVVVVLKSDRPYQISKRIVLEKNVTVCGETGNPLDVIVTRKSDVNVSIMRMSGERALVHSLTLKGGYGTSGVYGNGLDIDQRGTVSNCVICGCTSGDYHSGDALRLNGANAVATHCVVSNNAAGADGDARATGVGVYGGARLANSLICNNRETATGGTAGRGAVRMSGSGSLVENCTVVDNSARYCGGVYADGGTVRNCVIAGNKSTIQGSDYDSFAPGQEARFDHCACDTAKINDTCVQDAAANFFNGYTVGDYTVATGSKLIDAGAEPTELYALDLALFTRVMGEAIDIGAYEYDTSKLGVGIACDIDKAVLPVTATFTASLSDGETEGMSFDWDFDNDGTIDMTTTTPVAQHTYETAGRYSVKVRAYNAGRTREATKTAQDVVYLMPKTIYVVKGNAGAAFPYDSFATAAKTLPAALDVAIDGVTIVLSNGVHEVTDQIVVNKNVEICGLTPNPAETVVKRTDGPWTEPGFKTGASGVFIHGLTFDGGAVNRPGWFMEGGGVMSNCVIRNMKNYTHWAVRGAITAAAGALVTHCVITNNTGNYAGDGSMTIVYAYGGSRFENCLIACNKVTVDRPVVRGGNGAFVNCTVVSNVLSTGKLFLSDGATGVTNCIFAANARTGAGTDFSFSSGVPKACKNNLADTEVAGWLCEPDAAKVFVDPTANDWHLPVSSPARDRGARRVALPATDLDGKPRKQGRVDLGCFENPVGNGAMLLIR